MSGYSCLTCDAPENWYSHFHENDIRLLMNSDLLAFFLLVIALGSIIGWKFVWSIVKSPRRLKRELADRYIIFITSILNHTTVPTRFILFSLSLGMLLARSVIKFWSVPYPYWVFCLIVFPVGMYVVLFVLLTGYFLLCEKYPNVFGKFLIEFCEKNGSPEALDIVGLKSRVKPKPPTAKTVSKRNYSTTRVLSVEPDPMGYYQILAELRATSLEEKKEKGALVDVGVALDKATGVSNAAGLQILEDCTGNCDLCSLYVAELAKDPNYSNLAFNKFTTVKTSVNLNLGYRIPPSTETWQDHIDQKELEAGDSSSKEKSGLYGSVNVNVDISSEKTLQQITDSAKKSAKTVGKVSGSLVGITLALKALSNADAQVLDNAYENFTALEEAPSFGYEKSGETRLTKSEK